MLLFKIWNSGRTKKVFVPIDDAENIYENLILKASEKLQINGSKIVLESDGTIIDEDSVLVVLKDEILLLLEPSEEWKSSRPCSSVGGDSFNSESSTITVLNSSVNIKESARDTPVVKEPSSDENTRTSEYTWHNFSIPWTKLSDDTFKSCELGIKNKRCIAEVVHMVINSARSIKQDISSKSIKVIAHKMISKFPKTFQDIDDDGVVIGDGSVSLYCKLLDHLKYLNRNTKRSTGANVPINKKKKMLASKAGCANWQPDLPDENDSEIIQETLKTVNFENFDDSVMKMLNSTYAELRTFLNKENPPSIKDIFEHWPILLSERGLYYHYNQLMNHSIQDLGEKILLKSNKLICFGIKKKYVSSVPTEEDETLTTVFKILAQHFSENFDHLYYHLRNEKDFEKELQKDTSVLFPHILSMTEADTEARVYYVVMESTKINKCFSFRHAFQQVFSLYYVLNLEYPKTLSNTLEFVQRYFLKIHPDKGSKNRKSASKLKIISLINKLR